MHLKRVLMPQHRPTAGHQGYTPALPYMLNNAFGAFGPTADTDEEDYVDTIATQIAAVTMQSQLTATTAANSSQRHEQGMQALAQQQQLLHANQHQILEQLAALSFNASDAGQGIRRGGRGGGGRGTPPPTYVQAPTMPTTYQQGYGGRGRGRGRGRSGRGTQHQYSPGGFPHTQGMGDVFPPTYVMPPPAGGGGNMYNYAPKGGIPGNAPQGGMQQQEWPLCKLERMLHLWFRHPQRPHKHDMPGPTQGGSRRLLHTAKRAAIY